MSRKHRRASSGTWHTGATSPASNTIRASGTSEFNPDYSYVVKDLKKIGILAISFITVLVVLSFFLR